MRKKLFRVTDRRKDFVELKHCDFFAFQNLLEFSIAENFSPVTGVLQVMLFDVGPHPPHYLCSRQHIATHKLGKLW